VARSPDQVGGLLERAMAYAALLNRQASLSAEQRMVRDPTPYAPNPKPQPLYNPQPQTPTPIPETLHPTPYTLNRSPKAGAAAAQVLCALCRAAADGENVHVMALHGLGPGPRARAFPFSTPLAIVPPVLCPGHPLLCHRESARTCRLPGAVRAAPLLAVAACSQSCFGALIGLPAVPAPALRRGGEWDGALETW